MANNLLSHIQTQSWGRRDTSCYNFSVILASGSLEVVINGDVQVPLVSMWTCERLRVLANRRNSGRVTSNLPFLPSCHIARYPASSLKMSLCSGPFYIMVLKYLV